MAQLYVQYLALFCIEHLPNTVGLSFFPNTKQNLKNVAKDFGNLGKFGHTVDKWNGWLSYTRL